MNTLLCKYDVNDDTARWFIENSDNVYLVLDRFDADRDLNDSIMSKMKKVYVVSSFDSLEDITAVAADLISKGIRIDSVASFTEFSQVGAAILSQLLGVKHQSLETAVATRDKRMMKSSLNKSGIKTARWCSISSPSAFDLNVINEIGYPGVLKPAAGMGTISTYLVNGPDDLKKYLEGYQHPIEVNSNHLIYEQFIPGNEYHIDTVIDNKQFIHFTINKYYCKRIQANGELNGSYYLPECRHVYFYERCRLFLAKVLESLNITDGVTHCEFFVNDDNDLVFSEIATRFGGSGVVPVLKEALGYDLRELWVKQVTGKLDTFNQSARSNENYVGFINITSKQPGKIVSIPSTQDIESEDGVLKAVSMTHKGAQITLDNPSEWGIFVIASAESEPLLITRLQNVFTKYKIEVESD